MAAGEPFWLEAYGPGVPGHLDYGDTTLVDQFDATVAGHRDRPAYDFFGRVTTYAAFDSSVQRVAASLRDLGVGPGDRVVLMMPNSPQHLIAFQAVIRLGAIVAEHNPLYTASELAYPFADHEARVAIVWDAAVPVVKQLQATSAVEHIVAVDLTRELPLTKRMALRLPIAKAREARAKLTSPAPDAIPFSSLASVAPLPDSHPRPSADELALLLYTSGTTGSPKGVPLTHRNLVANCLQGRAWVPGLEEGRETFLAALPMFHAYGLTIGVLFGIAIGAKLVLIPKPETGLLMDALKKEVPGFIPAVPPLYARIAEEAGQNGVSIRGIRFALSGAMPLPVDLVESWESATGGLLVEGYGLTETSPVLVGNPMTSGRRPGSIGVPFPDVTVRVADPEDLSRDVDFGQRGELLVKGPQVFAGYRNLPEETEEAFHDGWFRTGDVVTMESDGFITVVDRIKEVVITGGFNVYPSEVEAVLREHPSVDQAAVVGIPQADGSEQVVAGVVLAGGSTLDQDVLWAHAKEHLASYKVPRRFVALPELPVNEMGKVLRREVVPLVGGGS